MAVHFSPLPDKMADLLLIIIYINNHLEQKHTQHYEYHYYYTSHSLQLETTGLPGDVCANECDYLIMDKCICTAHAQSPFAIDKSLPVEFTNKMLLKFQKICCEKMISWWNILPSSAHSYDSMCSFEHALSNLSLTVRENHVVMMCTCEQQVALLNINSNVKNQHCLTILYPFVCELHLFKMLKAFYQTS